MSIFVWKISNLYIKKCGEEKYIDLLLIEKEGKGPMFLSKISINSFMITH